ncbi:hypothetical protein D3C75_1036570 [compost metagenome]
MLLTSYLIVSIGVLYFEALRISTVGTVGLSLSVSYLLGSSLCHKQVFLDPKRVVTLFKKQTKKSHIKVCSYVREGKVILY